MSEPATAAVPDVSEIEAPTNHGPIPPFRFLVKFFERISNISGAGVFEKRRSLIYAFIKEWRETVGNDIYPAFQLMLPQIDAENTRQLYHLKEKNLGKILAAAMNLASTSQEAVMLKNYRQAKGKVAGNFPEMAYRIIEKRDSNLSFSETSITDVLSYLDRMANSKLTDQIAIMRSMLGSMCALEMKWLIRIILRYLNINVSEKTLFNCWHPDAIALYNVTNDLKAVCYQLWNPEIRLQRKDQEIRPLACFKPQKALYRRNAMEKFEDIRKLMPETFFIEEKVDGERMQMHFTDFGKTIKFFSRKGKDYTSYYGNSLQDDKGSLTRYLDGVFSPKVKTFILDGEMAAWDSKNEEVCGLSKVKPAAMGDGSGQFWPIFLVFDIVHVNGHDLAPVSLEDRKKALERLLPEENRAKIKSRLEILPYMRATQVSQMREVFDQMIKAMSEGIVVKNPLSRYTADGRNDAWLKIKPEFMPGFRGENFDLLVIGAKYGQGRKAKMRSSFLCALRNEASSEFYSLCNVANGFTMAMLQKIAHITEGNWQKFDRNNVPPNLKLGGVIVDDIIDPKKSVVLEVKATQITASDKYYAGYSLRFPRLVALREDKGPEDSLTFVEFGEVRTEQDPQVGQKRAQKSVASTRKKCLKIQYAENETESLDVEESTLFSGKSFFIAGDILAPKHMLQPDFERFIERHGAHIARSLKDGAIPVADRNLPRVAAVVQKKTSDVVHPNWFFDSVLNSRQLPFEPSHYLYALPSSQTEANLQVDTYNFPLYRDISRENLERLLANMPPVRPQTTEELNKAMNLLLTAHAMDHRDTRGMLFQGTTIFFDPDLKETDTRYLKRLVAFGGGVVTSYAQDPKVTHVVCEKGRANLYDAHKQHIVSPKWVEDSWNNETRLEENSLD